MMHAPHQSDDNSEHDPLRPHAHEPNPQPPSADPSFAFVGPDGTTQRITLANLRGLPQVTRPNCYIVSTGHGTSGPFSFAGPTLLELIESLGIGEEAWQTVEIVSADGFGTRVDAAELHAPEAGATILLAITRDGEEMTRTQGVVRLIVPSERDDALRQVKWIGTIRVV